MKTKRSNKINLENKKFIFFEIGVIISLAIVLAAFEWKSADLPEKLIFQGIDRDIYEEKVEITKHEKKEEPKKPEPKLNESIINEIEDGEKADDFDFSAEVTDDVVNDTIVWEPDIDPEPDEVIDIPFTVVEVMPQFIGGEPALIKYLADNINYPREAVESGITGKVFLTFVVHEDGSVRDISLLRGIGGGCDEEAVRVARIMPNWAPGKQRGVPVKVQFVLPITFKLR